MTTVYQIDLLSADSLGSLGTIQKIVLVTSNVCNTILQSILALDIHQVSPYKEVLENQIHMLKWYMNTLRDIDNRSAYIPYMDMTQVHLLRHIRIMVDEMPGTNHIRGRDEIFSMLLVNVMEGVFTSTLASVRTKSETNQDVIFDECEDMFKLIVRKCKSLFPNIRGRNVPAFESANMQVVLHEGRS
jgi:hypothetical protein